MSSKHLEDLMVSYEFTPRSISHCVHTILAHHGKQEYGSPVVPATIEAFLVHHCDMLSGHGEIYKQAENLEQSRALGTSIIKIK